MQRKTRRHNAEKTWVKLLRAALLGSTCMAIAALIPQISHAQSQIPADTTPAGGVVTAGSANIGQAPGLTTITQSSQRTAINWQSYNVGSAATVQYNQPSSTAAALNFVVTPSPSIIAGSIKANGQIIIVNQSGVLFTRGSEVNAQSVIATTSNLSVPEFMAGRLVSTDGPRLGAKIINDGVITAGQTGLVGLIAPQVANNGLIIARLGEVVLAGADAFTLDLYGDQLISLDVTQSVHAVDVGGKRVRALVTNRGIILANGGKVTLTAQDADALVTQLVDAGGAIVANTTGGKTGSIAIEGIGGDIKISGILLAAGLRSGDKGGTIQAVTTGNVAVTSSAIIASSGLAGGGVIALGTDATRALSGPVDTTAPQAKSVTITAGAEILSDAINSGNGGTVAVVSADHTSALGNISVDGGQNGGNGGSVEISSGNTFALGGSVSDVAPLGQGGNVLLEAPTLTVGGNVSPAVLDGLSGNLRLDAGTLISVIDPISIGDATVSLVSRGDVSIASQVDVAGSLNIAATNSLAINGGLNASEMSLSGGNITIDALIDPLGVLTLTSNGSIIESGGGVIDAGTLTGSALADVVLENAGNSIGLLDAFNAANFSLADADALTVSGPLQAGNVGLDAAALIFDGDVTATDLTLTSPDGISQTAGTISAGTLTGTAGSDVTLEQSNAITELGSFDAANFSLADAEALNVKGPLQASNVSLSASSIAFGGDVTAGDLTLTSVKRISQSAGTISAGTLTGTAGGDVTLDQSNAVAELRSFSAANFSLADRRALSVTGPLQAGNVSLSASSMDFGGDLTAGDLALASLDGISQTAGTISAGKLTGTAGGNVTLDQKGNNIGTLDSFTSANFSLADADTLTVNGPLQAGNVSLDASALILDGDVTASDLTLTSLNGISQNVGTIKTETLTGTAGGDVTLDQTGNAITELRSFSAANFNLADAEALTVNGPLQADNVGLDAATIAFAGNVTATDLTLTSLGEIRQNTGTITTGSLTGSAAGNVNLQDASNSIGTVGGFSAANFSLSDGRALSVTGLLQAGNIKLSASSINFGGNVIASDLTLTSLTNISQSAGAINTGTLTGTAGGDVTLDQNNNNIGTLNSFTSANFSLADAATLTVNGPLQAGNVSLNAAALILNGDVTASDVTLTSQDGISQIAGTISAGTLVGTAGGDVTLDQISNAILQLGGFGAANFSLVDAKALSVTGPLQASNISLSAASIAFAADVTASDLALISLNNISQTAGTISTATLTGTAGGDVTLDKSNAISELGSFSAANFSLDDAATLNLNGPLQAGNVTLDAATLDFNGNVTAGDLTLTSLGEIRQITGTITTGSLTGSAAGNVDLEDPSNSIGTLSGFSAANFNLVDGQALSISGPLQAGNVSLSAPSIDFGGDVSASNVTLTSLNNITQSAGTISTGTLTGTSGGDVTLDQNGNNIATLEAFTSAYFSLIDAGALDVTGPLSATNISLNANAIDFTDDLTATNLSLTASSNISQAAGTITTAMLTGTAGGSVTLDQSGNVVPVLNNFTAFGGASIVDAVALNLQGNINTGGNSLSLFTNGPIDQTSGLISAAVLNATAPAIDLPQANQIGTLGNVSTGSLVVNGIDGIAGSVFAQDATLVSAGNVALTGSVSISNDFSLNAAGNIIQPSGSIYALNAAFATRQPGDAIVLNGDDVIGESLNLSNAGEIIHSAGILVAGILTGTGGTLASFTGPTELGEIGSFVTSGSRFQLINTGNLTLNGPLVANNINISISGTLLLDGTAGGGLFFTGSEASPLATAPRPGIDSILRAGNIIETGTYYFNAGPNSPLYNSATYLGTSNTRATIFMVTAANRNTAGGNIAFAAGPAGLFAPAVNVVLNSGATGFETGNMDVYHLEILGGKYANLSGSIDGITGKTAAGRASAYPFPSKSYQFNGCTIGSLNCFTLSIENVPNQNPLDRFDLVHRKHRHLGKDVQLPGIATHDF